MRIILEDSEYREIQRLANFEGISIDEWVREALGLARERSAGIAQKLEAIRAAAQHDFPTGDIRGIVADIEKGYLQN